MFVTARDNREKSWWLLYTGIEYLLLFLSKHANKKYFFSYRHMKHFIFLYSSNTSQIISTKLSYFYLQMSI